MAEPKRMVTGFNHNVKHRGKVYHVQTEDSGLGNPHIITHLFVGGNVLASKKTSYSDLVGAENLQQVVRELMEEQHKEMLRNLVNGVYDEIDEVYAEMARPFQPGEIRSGDPARPPAAAAAGAAPAAESGAGWHPLHVEEGKTIVGEDIISEKSLDEVILSYLAEDTGERK